MCRSVSGRYHAQFQSRSIGHKTSASIKRTSRPRLATVKARHTEDGTRLRSEQHQRANDDAMTSRQRRRREDGLPTTARRRDEDTTTTANQTICRGPRRQRECSRFNCRGQKWELMDMHQRDVAGVLGRPRVCLFEISVRNDTSCPIIPEISIDDQVRDGFAVAPVFLTSISCDLVSVQPI